MRQQTLVLALLFNLMLLFIFPAAAQVVDLGTLTTLEQHSVTRVSETEGELETAVSADGESIVIAVNDKISGAPFSRPTVFFSKDGGETFSASTLTGTGICSLRNRRDPTVARGGTGNFYYAALCGGGTTTGSVVARSTNGGQTFEFRTDQATICVPDDADGTCNADQPHLAADPRNLSGMDQVYLVWREFDTIPKRNDQGEFLNAEGEVVDDVDEADKMRTETQMIECSLDGGMTWSNKKTVGVGTMSRLSVGPDGKIYVVWSSGRTGRRSIFLQRFSDCTSGLQAELTGTDSEPRHLVTHFWNVPCPVPGLDRCNKGNILSSPTVAVDQNRAHIVFVTYAHRSDLGNEDIMVIGSLDGGETFTLGPQKISGDAVSRKFLPWSCGANGELFVTWYDRRPATVQETDLTQFMVRSFRIVRSLNIPPRPVLRRSPELDLSGGLPDAQCAAGWPVSPRNIGDAENCSVQPQLAGVCAPAPTATCSSADRPAGCKCSRANHCSSETTCSAGFCIDDSRLSSGTAPRCDFSDPACADGESCQLGGGAPKYGDYNGFACAGRSAFVSWASGVPPQGIDDNLGFGVFHTRVTVLRSPRVNICDRVPNLCNRAPDMSVGVLDLTCRRPGCMVTDYLPDNCKRKFECPGCEPGQLCPPWYELTMNGLDRHWDVSVIEGSGKRVATKIRRKNGELRVAFRPDKSSFSPGEIGDYHLVFRSARGSPVAKANRIKMSIKRLNREPK